jgi:hypothetical protein
VKVVEVPAASAGGACVLWTYRIVERRIGVHFDVAASGHVDDTSTCVLQTAGAHRPDLLLSVVERSAADPALFAADLVPAHAKRVEGLGRAAYRLVSKAAGDHGPVVEVGWLSRDRQVITVRFTFARGASKAEATAMGTRLTSLARKLDAPIGRGA